MVLEHVDPVAAYQFDPFRKDHPLPPQLVDDSSGESMYICSKSNAAMIHIGKICTNFLVKLSYCDACEPSFSNSHRLYLLNINELLFLVLNSYIKRRDLLLFLFSILGANVVAVAFQCQLPTQGEGVCCENFKEYLTLDSECNFVLYHES